MRNVPVKDVTMLGGMAFSSRKSPSSSVENDLSNSIAHSTFPPNSTCAHLVYIPNAHVDFIPFLQFFITRTVDLRRLVVMSGEREVYECSLCDSRSPSLSFWMSHIRSVHVNDQFELSCPVGECSLIYSNVNSMCSHIYRKHSSSSRSRDVPGPSVPPEVAQPTGFSSDVMMDLSLPESVSHDVDQLQHRDEYKQKKESILFLLQLKEERMLTQSALNDVAGCQEVFKHTVGRLKAGVSRLFARNGINSECVEEINCIFDEAYDPFSGLESAYLQEKFIVQELGCVVVIVQ